MLRKFLTLLLACVLPLLLSCVPCDTIKIYDNLLQCYRGNLTEKWNSNSVHTLLEIIRKVENAYPTSLDIRILSANIIHRLRIDGIERAPNVQESDLIIPYRAKGIMLPKFQILLKLISDVPANLRFETILTPTELCHLHRMISSSVEPYIRGDETKICHSSVDVSTDWFPRKKVNILESGKVFVVSEKVSMCPIEMGIIRIEDYGTLSPGTVIAAIAAGLQPQMVPIKEFFPDMEIIKDEYENLETMERRDTENEIRKLLRSLNTIDNAYAASIAGDLAEVCFFQSPYYKRKVNVGTTGYWNDTVYPAVRYISENKYLNWAMTDSEILGGLDGLHIANNILSWTNRVRKMRLSQILDMYYSPRGIPTFAIENANQPKRPSTHGNYQLQNLRDGARLEPYKRHQISEMNLAPRGGFEDHFETVRYIDSACERKYILSQIPRGKLKDQTYFLALILQQTTSSVTMEEGLLRDSCNAAVDKFFEYATKLVDRLPSCNKVPVNYKRPVVDLFVIIDGSRTKWENMKLISYLTEVFEVSTYGTRLSVIHGTNGQYIVKETHSSVKVMEDMKDFAEPYPTALNLAQSLSTIILDMDYQKQEKPNRDRIAELSQVILVISQGEQIRELDFKSSRDLLQQLQFRDTFFVFLTDDQQTFEEMTADISKKNFIEKYQIIHSTERDPINFSKALSRAMLAIPKRLNVRKCGDHFLNDTMNIITSAEYEDYLSPNVPNFYRISAHQLICLRDLRLQFISAGYGDFTVCKSRNSTELQCQSTVGKDVIWFNFTQLCDLAHPELCSSLTFRVEMDSSQMKCSENDCRYPDQVRLLIRPENAECRSGSTCRLPQSVLLFVLLCAFFFIFII